MAPARARRLAPRRLALWLVGGAALIVVLAVGGTYIYIHVISGPAPAPLSLKSSAPATAAAGTSSSSAASTAGTATSTAGLAGSWQVASGSEVGYRVKEVLLGQDNIAVGRTSSVSGKFTISGTTVKAGTFTVQMATVKSDESQRDAQFNGRIMDTSQYPTGTLRLTSPIALAPVPATGTVKVYHAAGQLTLHGHTRAVSFALSAERASAGLEISGSIPIVFADYGIANPSFAGFVTTQNHGELEFLIKFSRS